MVMPQINTGRFLRGYGPGAQATPGYYERYRPRRGPSVGSIAAMGSPLGLGGHHPVTGRFQRKSYAAQPFLPDIPYQPQPGPLGRIRSVRRRWPWEYEEEEELPAFSSPDPLSSPLRSPLLPMPRSLPPRGEEMPAVNEGTPLASQGMGVAPGMPGMTAALMAGPLSISAAPETDAAEFAPENVQGLMRRGGARIGRERYELGHGGPLEGRDMDLGMPEGTSQYVTPEARAEYLRRREELGVPLETSWGALNRRSKPANKYGSWQARHKRLREGGPLNQLYSPENLALMAEGGPAMGPLLQRAMRMQRANTGRVDPLRAMMGLGMPLTPEQTVAVLGPEGAMPAIGARPEVLQSRERQGYFGALGGAVTPEGAATLGGMAPMVGLGGEAGGLDAFPSDEEIDRAGEAIGYGRNYDPKMFEYIWGNEPEPVKENLRKRYQKLRWWKPSDWGPPAPKPGFVSPGAGAPGGGYSAFRFR